MRNKIKYFAYMCLFALLISDNIKLNAQNPVTPPAEKKLEVLSSDEIAKLKSIVDDNPEDLKVHKEYIKAVGLGASDKLIKQYELWMVQFPKSVTVPFAIGKAFYEKERVEASPYLLKVIEL